MDEHTCINIHNVVSPEEGLHSDGKSCIIQPFAKTERKNRMFDNQIMRCINRYYKNNKWVRCGIVMISSIIGFMIGVLFVVLVRYLIQGTGYNNATPVPPSNHSDD